VASLITCLSEWLIEIISVCLRDWKFYFKYCAHEWFLYLYQCISKNENVVGYILNSVDFKGSVLNFAPMQYKLTNSSWTICEIHSSSVLTFSLWMFSAIRSGDHYMFDDLDDDGVLEERDEVPSGKEGGKHDGKREVMLSKVNSFLMYVSLEKRMSVCGTTVVWTGLCQWFPELTSVEPLIAGITLDYVTFYLSIYLKLPLWNFIYLFACLYWTLLYDTYFFL